MLFLALGVLTYSCSNHEKSPGNVEYQSLIHGLASPVKLELGETKIRLADYFTEVNQVQTATLGDITLQLDSAHRAIVPQNISVPLGNLHVTAKGVEHDIPVFASEKVYYEFSYKPSSESVSEVAMAGSMNSWNKKATPLTKQGDTWKVKLELEPGLYQYRIWEGEKELLDANNPNKMDNGMGGFNSTFTAGEARGEKPVLLTQKASENTIDIACSDTTIQAQVYFQNKMLPTKAERGQIHIEIPAEAKSLERSFIRVYAHNGKLRSNDVLVPLTHGDVVMNTSSLNRHDKQGDIMYFMMVDRFVDGDSTNNRPTLDPSIMPKANNFGGDLAGITQKIKDGYFKSLGINTIWVSPISQNAEGAWGLWDKGVVSKFSAYHGYWPTSLQQIDNRFGTEAQFKELIQVAHDHNMNVVLDYVAHHVHQDHPLHKMKPEWSTSLYLPDGTMNTEKWDEHRLTTWFDTFLPTWDFSKPEVVEALTDTAMFWVKNYDLDGFRHDATKHIPVEFWQTLTHKVKKEIENNPNKRIFQIGETYGNPQLIGSYISSGQLDAQFDFNLYDAAVDAFAKDETSFANLKRVLNQSLEAYGAHHLMGNITGNQDRARFASYADGAVQFSEDPKLAGWTRNIEHQGNAGFQKMSWLNAFIMTVPGIPCIYYGDEIAMPGANDPDNRRMMHFNDWSEQEKALHADVAELTSFRNSHLAMTYGDLVLLGESDDALVYARNYFGQTAIVVFSKRPAAEVTFTVPTTINVSNLKALKGSTIVQQGQTFSVTLSGKSGYDILFN